MLIYKQNNAAIAAAVKKHNTAKRIKYLEHELTNICNNGCFIPSDIHNAHTLLCEYKEITGKEFELNKENSIV